MFSLAEVFFFFLNKLQIKTICREYGRAEDWKRESLTDATKIEISITLRPIFNSYSKAATPITGFLKQK